MLDGSHCLETALAQTSELLLLPYTPRGLTLRWAGDKSQGNLHVAASVLPIVLVDPNGQLEEKLLGILGLALHFS